MSVSATPRTREYVQTDGSQLWELYAKAFGPTASAAFRLRWRWEFERSPALQRYANLLAEQDHRLVAHLGRLSVRLSLRDSLVPAVFLTDLMADPGGAGVLVLELVGRCLREPPVVLHFGGTLATRRILRRMGMRPLPLGEILLRVERPAGALAALAHRRLAAKPGLRKLAPRWLFAPPGALIAPICARLYRWGRRLSAGSYEIMEAPGFDERFDDLWQAMRGQCPVMCARDRAFLAWRYGEAPAGRYLVLTATRPDGTLAAASVLTQVSVGPARYGKFMECLYRDDDALAALINASLAAFRSMQVDMIVSVGLSRRVRELLRAVGFRHYRERSFMLKSNLGQTVDALLSDARGWYVSPGDGDEDFAENLGDHGAPGALSPFSA